MEGNEDQKLFGSAFWKMLLTKQSLVATDFHSIFFLHIMEVNKDQKLFGNAFWQFLLYWYRTV